ncbi:MAG: AAA family ATPase [Candidatus Polarisedimenticolaceae bacterium]|nr:AAA family ATPase [Candidatus Polarisedimenticolaceae bacterium]
MSVLKLISLGGFQVLSADEKPLSNMAKKAKALLVYLALNPEKNFSRERLASLLWEDSSESQARHSLRQTLAALRKLLPEQQFPLITDSASITFKSGVIEVDATEFERLISAGDQASLEAAVARYKGDFLEGFSTNASTFEDWMMGERSRLCESALEAMSALLPIYLKEGALERAVQLAIRMLSLDVLQEPVHRTLMTLYSKLGRHGAALKQYRLCRNTLRKELNVLPEEETQQLYRNLLEQRNSMSQPDTDAPIEVAQVEREETATERLGVCDLPLKRDAIFHSPELRQSTIMFVTLVGYSRCSVELATDELQNFTRRFFDIVSKAAAHWNGRSFQPMSDTVMVVFGVPKAHTDDAKHALQSVGRIHYALSQPDEENMEVKVGIASGRLLVSHIEDEYYFSGKALLQATRLAEQAKAGEILISRAVYRSQALCMVAEQVEHSDGESRAWSVTSMQPEQILTPLVGRRREMRLYSGALEDCLDTGCGQSFLIRGESGIGKTRLMEEFSALAIANGFEVYKVLNLDFGGGANHEALPMLARCLLQIPHNSDLEQSHGVVEKALHNGLIEAGHAAFINELLDLPQSAEQHAMFEVMDRTTRQRKTETALSRLIEMQSQQQPLLLLVEDIHWAGSMTLACLAHLAATVVDFPVLLVMTSRVEGEPLDPAWRNAMQGAPLTTIDLNPLREKEALALAASYNSVDELLRESCIQRAEGNPLFLDQLLRAAVDGETSIPDSIQSIVWVRLDRLAKEDKEAIQAASILGQYVPLPLLRFLIDKPDYQCTALLARQLLRSQYDELLFTHALVQEGIYSSLLKSKRDALHLRAAAWYADSAPELQAEHLDRAGDPGAAAAYFTAAELQMRHYHHDRALHLLASAEALPVQPELTFELKMLRGGLMKRLGDLDASVQAYEEALEVAEDDAQRVRAWIGQVAGLNIQDNYQQALVILDRAETVAKSEVLPNQLAKIHYLRGSILFPMGYIDGCLKEHDLALSYARKANSPHYEAYALSGLGHASYQSGQMVTAHARFDQCIELCHQQKLSRLNVTNYSVRSMTHFYQNHPLEARQDIEFAISMAVKVGNLHGEMAAHLIYSNMLCYWGEREASQPQIEKGLALACKLGSRRYEATCLGQLGTLLGMNGFHAEAEKQFIRAYELTEESLRIGPSILGPWALTTRDDERRAWALKEGARLLAMGGVSHNQLIFLQCAIEVSLQQKKYAEVEHYVEALERYTAQEPLPWSDLIMARGRALALCGLGTLSDELPHTLQRLHDQVVEAGLKMILPPLENALK